jgi:hypothetical protein
LWDDPIDQAPCGGHPVSHPNLWPWQGWLNRRGWGVASPAPTPPGWPRLGLVIFERCVLELERKLNELRKFASASVA